MQKTLNLEYHRKMSECPLHSETAANKEDQCKICTRARELVGWPARLEREYTNPANGRKAFECKYIPYVFPSKLNEVAKQMLYQHYKVDMPSEWAACKGLQFDADPPAQQPENAPEEPQREASGAIADAFDTFCRPAGVGVPQGAPPQGGQEDIAATMGAAFLDETEIAAITMQAAAASQQGAPANGRRNDGQGQLQQQEEEEEVHLGGDEDDSEGTPPRDPGVQLQQLLERRRRPVRNAKRPLEEDFILE